MIGEMECTLAEIVTAGQRYERKLRYKGNWLFFRINCSVLFISCRPFRV